MQIKLFDLGLIGYEQALSKQQEVFAEVLRGSLDSALITCRHYPVITYGRQAGLTNLKVSQGELKSRGIELSKTERGGDITYHGPGQLMVYPILNLNYFRRDIHWYLRKLEELAMGLLEEFAVFGQVKPGLTGVWWQEQKIASIGIAIRKWITFYGFALNIKKDDLESFSLIRPCGMDIRMASVESVLGTRIAIENLGTPFLLKLRVSLSGDTLPISTKGVPG
jgi:lipoyl(octanoyl) transferase